MQVVILAAGKGTRMGSLTESIPKPMLLIGGRTLLEHKFASLPESVDEIILVIGYQGHVIREAYGNAYKGKKIQYVEQEELNGTMGAVLLAKPLLKHKFLVMMGDDLYATEDVLRTLASSDWALLVEQTDSMREGGRIVTGPDGTVSAIEEGDHQGKPGLMNTNMVLLDERIFSYPMVPKASGSSEFGLPQTVVAVARAGSIPLHAIPATGWFQVTSAEDIKRATSSIEEESDT